MFSFQLPKSQVAHVLSAVCGEEETRVTHISCIPAIASAAICATREHAWDFLVVKPDHRLVLLTHGLREIPIKISGGAHELPQGQRMEVDEDSHSVVRLSRTRTSSVAVTFTNGQQVRLDLLFRPSCPLTAGCLSMLAHCLTQEAFFLLHCTFLDRWSAKGLSLVQNIEFNCLTDAIYTLFQLQSEPAKQCGLWDQLGKTASHRNFKEDPILRKLRRPPDAGQSKPLISSKKPSKFLSCMLYGFHTYAEYLRFTVSRFNDLVRLVPVISRIAVEVRPEWADYWQRLVPDPTSGWPSVGASRMCNLYFTL